jgi:hypothetical protein
MTQPHPQQRCEKVWKLTARGDAGMTIERDTDIAYLRNQKRRYENMGMDCRIEESLCQPDTHTPAAPAAPEPKCDDCRFVKECPLLYFPPCEQLARNDERHYREKANAERERVLDKLIALHAGCYYDKGKDEHQSWVDSIESLRGGGA